MWRNGVGGEGEGGAVGAGTGQGRDRGRAGTGGGGGGRGRGQGQGRDRGQGQVSLTGIWCGDYGTAGSSPLSPPVSSAGSGASPIASRLVPCGSRI